LSQHADRFSAVAFATRDGFDYVDCPRQMIKNLVLAGVLVHVDRR